MWHVSRVGNGGSRSFEREGGEDNFSAPSTFIANAHNELYDFSRKKAAYLQQFWANRRGAADPTAPSPPLNPPLVVGAAINHIRTTHRASHIHSQNSACRHGTSAKPARGAIRRTSQQSTEVDAAIAVADSDATEFVALAQAPDCPRFRCCCCCCRPAAVGTLYERRHLHSWKKSLETVHQAMLKKFK